MLKSFRAIFSMLAFLALAPTVLAQEVAIPSLIRIVVPFSPGASTDVIARAIAAQLATRLGATVIVENKPGGSTFIGAAAVAKGRQDGSMLLFTSISTLTAAATAKIVPLDVVADLVPIAILGEGPLVLAVTSRSDIRTPADFVAAVRTRPDKVTNGSGGVGTIQHLAVELLNDAARIQMRHIPYKGSSPGVIDLAAGTIDSMFATNSTIAPQVNAGRVRQIAVTSLKPSAAFPGLPTMASVVPGFEVSLWTAMYAPAGTPAALVRRLNREINEIGKSKELRELMLSDGAISTSVTPEEASARVRSSFAAYKKIAAEKNIVLD